MSRLLRHVLLASEDSNFRTSVMEVLANISVMKFVMHSVGNAIDLMQEVESVNPALVIIDSSMHGSNDGTVAQVRGLFHGGIVVVEKFQNKSRSVSKSGGIDFVNSDLLERGLRITIDRMHEEGGEG